jgi:hypothetical protein
MNLLLLIPIIIIIIILIIYLVIIYINKTRNSPILIKKIVNGFDNSPSSELDKKKDYKFKVKSEKIPDIPNKLVFSYSFWLYIDNIGSDGNWEKYNGNKNILNRGNSPSFSYKPKNNSFIIDIVTGSQNPETFILKEILKNQKWVHICVVLDTRNLDVYIDGKMNRSFIIKEVPKLNVNDIKIFDGNNIYAKICYLRYFNYILTPNEIKNIYKRTSFKEKIILGISGNEKKVMPSPGIFWWL